MAFSPIDPSRLQGEALNRWYLRSPGEIEQERRAAQAQNYDAFFGGAEPAAPSASYQDANAAIDDGPAWTTNEADRWKGDNQSAYGPASDRQSRYFQVSAASQPLAAHRGNAFRNAIFSMTTIARRAADFQPLPRVPNVGKALPSVSRIV